MNVSEQENDSEQIIDLLFQLGVTYMEKGDYASSIEKFKKILELGEPGAKVYLNLSKVYILKEQFDEEAQEIFEKSLQFEPENPVLNVILGQIYLDADREDEQAFHVYQNALKHNPKNAEAISAKLIKATFKQGNIETARNFMQQFIDEPEKISTFLPLYIVNEWKHQGFERVAQYLKNIIKIEQSALFYRWLVVNFLQAEKQSLEPFVLSAEDLSFCNQYLENMNSCDQLLDIYLYPAIERLVLKYSKKVDEEPSSGVEEFEVFLAENAFTNIWEKALNQNDEVLNNLNVQEGRIWEKLKLWNSLQGSTSPEAEPVEDDADRIHEICNQSDTMMVLRLKGTHAQAVNEAMSQAISTVSDFDKNFVGGIESRDGFLLFWKDIDSPLQTAINFIHDRSLQGNLNSNNDEKFQFIIHKLSRRGKNRKRNLTYDLQTMLATFQLEREMFFQENQLDQWEADSNCQLLITSPIKKKIDGNTQFSFESVELSVQHPNMEKELELYKVTWNDSSSRIERGEIQEIGRFKLLKELHQNQVFSSFKAVDSFLDRLVVVKILRPDFSLNGDQNSTAKLFLQDAKFLGQITHPNIALVYDIGKDQDFCYIAREYVEGVPLTVQRSINQKINIHRTLKICLSLVQTLNSLHSQNIVHGRLQPNNIFVLNNHEVKIADFQVASLAIPIKNYQTPSLKYLTYFAPEQIEGEAYNKLTDIFSLGVIMYEMLTNHNPFYDEDRNKIFDNILNGNPEKLSSYNSELPKKLDKIVLKTLEKSPKKRCEDMGLVEKELIGVIGELGN